MKTIKMLTTAYDAENSCEYIELDEKLNILERKTINKIKNASSIIPIKNGFAISEEEMLEGKIHLLNEEFEIRETIETGVPGIVYLDYQNDTIWGASYTTGEFFSFYNGIITKYKEGNENSKLHCIKNIKDNIYTVNCSQDAIYIYKNIEGKAVYYDKFEFNENTKPRHLFEKNGYIYVICENSNEIYLFDIEQTGNLIFLDKYTTMSEKNIESFASTLYFNKNQLYSLNRGKNTIAIFNIVENGRLKLLKEVPAYGDYPWSVAGDKLNHLFIANYKSNSICIFNILNNGDIKFEKSINKLGVNNILII